MTKLSKFNTYLKIASLFFLLAGFFGITLPSLLVTTPVEKQVEQITDFQNITMCERYQ